MSVPSAWFDKKSRFLISLGEVKNLAVVTINGKTIGTAWHTPYKLDATNALKPGPNKIELRVTNAWVNRLIGDEQPNAVHYTSADMKPYTAASALMPSGLSGPVALLQIHVR